MSLLFILILHFELCLTFMIHSLSRGENMVGLNMGSVDDICWVSFEDAITFSELRKQFRCVALC